MFQMVFKTRCSGATSARHIPLHMRGISIEKSYISTPQPKTWEPKCQSSKTKAKLAFCHYHLHGIMNRERRGRGQQRTSEARFIISLPTDVPSLLLLFQYVSCQDWKFAARKQWRRSGPGGVGREGKEAGAKERRGGTQHTLLKWLAFICTLLFPHREQVNTLPGANTCFESKMSVNSVQRNILFISIIPSNTRL